MTDAPPLPRMLRRNAETMAERPALREKNLGIWQTYSWARYYQKVRDFALGLAPHGCRSDGRHRPAALWGPTRGARPRWRRRAGISGFDRCRTRLCPQPCRDLGHRRRRPGAGRQDPVADGPVAASQALYL